MEEYEKEILELVKGSFGINLNANDFFNFACADVVTLCPEDFKWAMPIIRKYSTDGVHAVMCSIAKQMPLDEWVTTNMKKAMDEIKAMKIEIHSNY